MRVIAPQRRNSRVKVSFVTDACRITGATLMLVDGGLHMDIAERRFLVVAVTSFVVMISGVIWLELM